MAINQEYNEYRVNDLPSSGNPGDRYYLNVGGGKFQTYIVADSQEIVKESGAEFIELDAAVRGDDTPTDATVLRELSAREIWAIQNGYYKGVKLNGYYAKDDTPAPIEYYLSDTTEEDDGGGVFEVGGIKLEHDFGGIIDILYYGAQNGIFPASLITKTIEQTYIISNNIDLEGNDLSLHQNVKLEFKGGSLNNGRYTTAGVVVGQKGTAILQRSFIREINAVDYIDASTRSGQNVFLNRIITKVQDTILTQVNRYNNNFVLKLSGSFSWSIESNTTTDIFNFMSIDGDGAVVIVQDYDLESDIPMLRTIQTPNGKNNRMFIKNLNFETRNSTINNPIINIHSTFYITLENISCRNIGNSIGQIVVKQTPNSYLDGIVLRDFRIAYREISKYPSPNILLYRGEGHVIENMGDGITIFKQNGIINIKNIINPNLILINVSTFNVENIVRETGVTYIYKSYGSFKGVGFVDNMSYATHSLIVDDEDIIIAYTEFINTGSDAIEPFNKSTLTFDSSRFSLTSYYRVPPIEGQPVPSDIKKEEESILIFNDNCQNSMYIYGKHQGYNIELGSIEKIYSNNFEGIEGSFSDLNNVIYTRSNYYLNMRPDLTYPDSLVADNTGTYYIHLDIFLNYKRKLGFQATNYIAYAISNTGSPSIGTFGFRRYTFNQPVKNVTAVAYLRDRQPNQTTFLKKSVVKIKEIDSEGMWIGYMPPNFLLNNVAEDSSVRESFTECYRIDAMSNNNLRAYLPALPVLGEWENGDEVFIEEDGVYRYYNEWVKIVDFT